MHPDTATPLPIKSDPLNGDQRPGGALLNRYHWFVLTVAAARLAVRCMDQQLFILARVPAMEAARGGRPGGVDMHAVRRHLRPLATAIFIIGWATGDLIFGVLGDRVGHRPLVMLWTILIYSLCTGLTAFSVRHGLFPLPLPHRLWASGASLPSASPRCRSHARSRRDRLLWDCYKRCPQSATFALIISMGFGKLAAQAAIGRNQLLGGLMYSSQEPCRPCWRC